MNLGQTIKMIRKEKGISQKELAQKSGLSGNALCSIENDKSFPCKDTINSICKALNISAGFLLFASLTEDDIPKEKLPIFRALHEPIMKLFI